MPTEGALTMDTSIRPHTSLFCVAMVLLAGCGKEAATGPAATAATPAPASSRADLARVQEIGRAALRSASPAPAARFPTLNTSVLDAMAGEVPGLAAHRARAEAGERAAIDKVIAQVHRKLGKGPKRKASAKPRAQLDAPRHPVLARLEALLDAVVPAAHAEGNLTLGDIQALLAGSSFVKLLGDFGDQGKIPPGGDPKGPFSEYKDDNGHKATFDIVGEKDGTPTVSLVTDLAVPIFGMDAHSRVALTTAGLCPDASGRVEFKLNFGKEGRAGSGKNVMYDRNQDVEVILTVDDNAEIASGEYKTSYSARSTQGGRQVYVEGRTNWSLPAGGDMKNVVATRSELVRASSQAVEADMGLFAEGVKTSLLLAMSATMAARDRWQSGSCIKIKAESPGRVARGATSRIPVKVMHRIEDREIGARVTVALTGGKSVAPPVIPKSPGDVTHVASSDRKAAMKITLTATSRRGKDKLELTLDTAGQAFRAQGGIGDFHGSGTICDITQPFTTEGGGTVVKYVPTSDRGGNYTYEGTMRGWPVFGHGTYVVDYQGDSPVKLTITGPGSVKTPMGVFTKVGSAPYALTPSEGCNP